MTIFLAAMLGVLLLVLHRVLVAPRRLARWVDESFVAADYGLVPREELDAQRSGPPPAPYRLKEMQAVADAAWEGQWQVAEAYVEAAGRDWDERWSRTEFLQQVAAEDDTWLDAWRAAMPANGDAATIHAGLMVHRAWEIRGAEYADAVPRDRMNTFRTLLPAAIEQAHRAARLDPENPGPWVVMVTAARGAEYRREQFQPLWDGLVARAPHHYAGHWQGLQFWCAKWLGSDKLMRAFAEQAVRHAPPGSPLAGMHLHALEELAERAGASALPAGRKAKGLLTKVAASLAEVAPDNEHLPALRHLLAHHMLRSKMHAAALEQFRLIGPWCGAQPWRKGDNPVMAFELARGTAAKLSGTGTAPRGQGSVI
ncbi:hypothetical protein AB0E82_30445 [Streptomyces anulatus]|uniref:hypothetical protein n=1 Tax=Streptomyces TaxID=1883 RepID=UPI0009A179D4|nr:hypothetical protein [Streptomyces sp. CB02115]